MGRSLAGRVVVAVSGAAAADRQLAVCGGVGAGHGVGPLRAFSSCRRRLADSRLRQRSRSLEHSGEHVVVRGKAMCRARVDRGWAHGTGQRVHRVDLPFPQSVAGWTTHTSSVAQLLDVY